MDTPSTTPSSISCWVYDASPASSRSGCRSLRTITERWPWVCPGVGTRTTSPASVSGWPAGKSPTGSPVNLIVRGVSHRGHRCGRYPRAHPPSPRPAAHSSAERTISAFLKWRSPPAWSVCRWVENHPPHLLGREPGPLQLPVDLVALVHVDAQRAPVVRVRCRVVARAGRLVYLARVDHDQPFGVLDGPGVDGQGRRPPGVTEHVEPSDHSAAAAADLIRTHPHAARAERVDAHGHGPLGPRGPGEGPSVSRT